MMKSAVFIFLGAFIFCSSAAADLKHCPSKIITAKTTFNHNWFVNADTKKFQIITSDGTKVGGTVLAFFCSSGGDFAFDVVREDHIRHACVGKYSDKSIKSSFCGVSENIDTGSFE